MAAVLVSTLSLFVSQIAGARTSIRERATNEAHITLVFDSLTDALVTSLAKTNKGQAGVVGDSLSIEVSFEGTTIQRALESSPERVLAPEDRFGMTFDPQSGSLSLQRDSQSTERPIVDAFAIRLRYYDGSLWYEEWNSLNQSGLPVAIEISVWLNTWPNEEIPEWFPDLDMGVGSVEPRSFQDEDAVLESFGTLRELDEREDIPTPDRRRIIAVPDAQQTDESLFFETTPGFLPEDEMEPVE